jgi:tetratricopeptide (TPR) repeat protein
MFMRTIATLALAALFAVASSGLASAAGGGGGTSNTTPSVQKCKRGEVFNKKKKKCLKVESGVLDDEDLYEQGRVLAEAGEYDWALEVLAVVQKPDDPRVLNYQGYANRKAGRLEAGIVYYRKALAIDPDFVLAREYLGEGYVAAGRVDLAKAELAEIAARCGMTCEEYKDLAAAIGGAQ